MIRFQRPPLNDDELHAAVATVFGVDVPRKQVCENHVAPFTAFSHAFFAKEPNTALWYGSRGTGKSYMLALLGLAKTVFHMGNTTILGGSIHQSNNVYNHMEAMMRSPNAPSPLVESFTKTELMFGNHTWVRPLSASATSVRGPHPLLHLLDEIDEMEWSIYTSSLGQAMRQPNALGVELDEYVVKSSTWQHIDGTFARVKAEHEERGLPVFTWCVASGSLVTTDRGQVPIQEVTDKDRVLTRQGWRHVQHVTFMGYKPTIALHVGEQTLRVTGDHRIAVPDGWQHASALAADTMSPVRANPRVVCCELVPSSAVGVSSVAVDPRPASVLSARHGVQVLDVDALRPTTQVVEMPPGWDGTDQAFPDPAVGWSSGASARQAVDDSLDSVSVAFGSRPVDAVSGEHGNILEPVWDIGVEGAHEFVANGIVVHNCWREMLKPHGWMDQDFIDRKRLTIPSELWRIEYDLGEPSGDASVFDVQRLSEVFRDVPEDKVLSRHSMNDNFWVYEAPKPSGVYAMGVDLAKSKDWTVAIVARVDVEPIRIVAVKKVGRIPWDVIIAQLKALREMYGGCEMGHDGTGLGSVVTDLLDGYSRKYLFIGEQRKKLLNEMIANVENKVYRFPNGNPLYNQFKATKLEDVWSTTLVNSHLPDETAAMAVLNAVCQRVALGVFGQAVRPEKKDRLPAFMEEMVVGVRREQQETFLFDEPDGYSSRDSGSVFVPVL